MPTSSAGESWLQVNTYSGPGARGWRQSQFGLFIGLTGGLNTSRFLITSIGTSNTIRRREERPAMKSLLITLQILSLSLLFACGSSSSAPADGAPAASDALESAIDGAVKDRDWYCAACLDFRCPEEAECFRDEECREVYNCFQECADEQSCTACGATSGVSRESALAAASCATQGCWTSCVSASWPPDPENVCVAAGLACEPDLPGLDTCCSGDCSAEPEDEGHCCLPTGSSCESAAECCGASVCEDTCQPKTCETDGCDPGGLPCCTSGFICDPQEAVGIPGLCCAPDFSIVNIGESCCSLTSTTLVNGSEQCIPNEML